MPTHLVYDAIRDACVFVLGLKLGQEGLAHRGGECL